MNKKFFLLFALAAPFAAVAQNLNPEIIVTNEYETRMPEVPKKDVPMALPDSLRDFNLSFDYSVFENPYRSTGSFTPYVVSLSPAKETAKLPSLWLEAAAGWIFDPELRAVWTPVKTDRTTLTVHQDFSGYSGAYRTVGADLNTIPGSTWDGYDLGEIFGVQVTHSLPGADLSADFHYDGIFTGEAGAKSSWNSFGLDLGAASGEDYKGPVEYDLGFGMHFSSDRTPGGKISGSEFNLGGTLKPVITGLGLDVFAETALGYASYSGLVDTRSLSFLFGPRAELHFGRLGLTAGINISVAGSAGNPGGQYGRIGQIIYPDLKVNYTIPSAGMALYATVKGGATPVLYTALKEGNNRITPAGAPSGTLLDNEIEHINATMGLRGRISQWLQYDASVGYGVFSGSPFDAVFVQSSTGLPFAGVTYADQGLFHADIFTSAKLGWFSFDGAFAFRDASVGDNVAAVLPSPFAAALRLGYNRSGRISVSVHANICSARKALVPVWDGTSFAAPVAQTLPGYTDLGVKGTFSLTRRCSLWARVGNILNADIQKVPLYAENGTDFTLGICLIL